MKISSCECDRHRILCYIAGLAWLIVLPKLTRDTYISENALLPGQSRPTFDGSDGAFAVEAASRCMQAEKCAILISQMTHVTSPTEWLLRELETLHVDAALGSIIREEEEFLIARGILRSKRADGTEALLLSTAFGERCTIREAASVGVSLALLRRLQGRLVVTFT